MTRRIVLGVAIAVGAFFGGRLTTHTPSVVKAPAAVTCPTEDSCNVDYYGHAWHIVPGRPS
jgi:hypothetical protein